MREQIARAQQGEAPLKADANHAQSQEERTRAHQEALLALRHWYLEWSEIARAVVSRRDYLIQLGLAQRKIRKT